jgi:hypothetical protein
MRVGAEAAIADHDVAFLQFGVEVSDLTHVVRPQRRRQYFQEKTATGVKQGQHMGDGKAATRSLNSGLAECTL